MSIHRIEFLRPVSSLELDPNLLDRDLQRGWLIAQTLATGQHPDILPEKLRRIMMGKLTAPTLVHPDGSGMVTLVRNSAANLSSDQTPLAIEIRTGRNAPRPRILTPDPTYGIMTHLSLPENVYVVPFAGPSVNGNINLYYGLVFYSPGFNPESNTSLTTLRGIAIALNVDENFVGN